MPGIHAGGALAAIETIDSPLTPALVVLAGGARMMLRLLKTVSSFSTAVL